MKYEILEGYSAYDKTGDPLPQGKRRLIKFVKVYEVKGKRGEPYTLKEVDGHWVPSTHPDSKICKMFKRLKVTSLKELTKIPARGEARTNSNAENGLAYG